MSQKQLKTTTAVEWTRRNNQVKTIELPSGAVVKVRVMSLFDLASLGHIPMSLVGDVLMSANSFLKPVDSKDVEFEWAKVTEKQIDDMLLLFRKAATVAVTEPRLSFEPESEDVADVTQIDFEDLAAIFQAAVKMGAAEMLPFRPKQEPGAPGGPGGKAIRTAAVNDAGSKRQASGA